MRMVFRDELILVLGSSISLDLFYGEKGNAKHAQKTYLSDFQILDAKSPEIASCAYFFETYYFLYEF